MAALFLLFMMFTALLVVMGTVFWIWMLVDCVNNKSLQDSSKAVWVLFIVFTHFIGAFFYLIIGRKPQPIIVYQQPNPFQQPMGGTYQPGNVSRNNSPFYQPQPQPQAPSQPSYPPARPQNTPHTSYYPPPQYPPAYQPGTTHGEYIPHETSSSSIKRSDPAPAVAPRPAYQEGYVPQLSSSEETRTSTNSRPWPKEDEPQAIYPELPQQEQQQ